MNHKEKNCPPSMTQDKQSEDIGKTKAALVEVGKIGQQSDASVKMFLYGYIEGMLHQIKMLELTQDQETA